MHIQDATKQSNYKIKDLGNAFLSNNRFDPWACGKDFGPRFFPRIDRSMRQDSFLSTAVHCFYNVYVGKQQVVWKEYCAKYWLTCPKSQILYSSKLKEFADDIIKFGENGAKAL